ncbi:hypothetical protein [Sporofaciens sp. JLR.KK001]|uniref:hypothetical protein n=1 Tax=Sporofaciens sp. JLR.KK001 TaxID=3112621 RepID=UPI002FF24935
MNGMIRRNFFWLDDKIYNNSLVKKQYDEIMYAFREEENLLTTWMQQRKCLLDHATQTTKFYSSYEGKSFEKFPVINKSICLENYKDFVSKNYKAQKIHRMSTNGSSGTPFTIIQDIRKRSRVIAELKAFMALRGLLPNQKMIYLDAMSARNKGKTRFEQWKENIWRVDISNLGRENVEDVIMFMQKHAGKLVLGYPSTMECIANYSTNDDRIKKLGIQTVITAGETLHSETRRKAKRVFGKNCDVLSRYSNQEMGILGQEKEEYGSYLLNHSSYYFECLDLNEDKPAKEGDIGRIVITDLYNYAFPLIRYDTEDTGIIGMDQNVSIYPVLKTVFGKKKDILFDCKKEPVIPDVIDEMFYGKDNIKQWKLIQKDYTKIRLIVNCNENGKRDVERICSKLKKHFGNETQIAVDYVDQISDEKGGKYRYIVCEIPGK